MSLPHLHIFHPSESVAGYLVPWLAEVEALMLSDTNWDACVRTRTQYNQQAGFDIGAEVGRVRRSPGPVVFIQKVRSDLLNTFRLRVQREISVYSINATCALDIWRTCEQARAAYEDGEPRIALRELIAYLIVVKLAKMDKWGGTSLNKSFLWASDLPNGGFPKGLCSNRDILQVADALLGAGVLTRKKSQHQTKYALGDKKTVQKILDSKTFGDNPILQNYFGRDHTLVSARLLGYNE
ncbi:MAG TPA: hypothetical protein VGY55_09600 [Pirellulales bacterium]|jgi:hypothetical protein|nr:hypothetical protein [Pirellulales bacterium]